MNKETFVNFIASQTNLSKKDSESALKAVLTGIQDSLAKGEDVNFIGFGSFSLSKREERIGQNPKTGEKLKIPASNTVKFKIGKGLKEAVNA